MGGYSSDKTHGHTFNLSECSYSKCVSKNVMPNFHSSFMFVFIRRHLPAVALLQSLLAAGGDALNSAVASLLVRHRSVLCVYVGRTRFVKGLGNVIWCVQVHPVD